MEKNYLKVLIFVSLTLILSAAAINLIADPFQYFDLFKFKQSREIAATVSNERLYKMLLFGRRPSGFLIFGDSRSDALKVEYFKELGHPEFFNFAFGGGTLFEAIRAYWFARKLAKPGVVLFGVPFDLYDDNNTMDLVSQSESLIDSSLAYLLNWQTLKSSLAFLRFDVTGIAPDDGTPKMSKEVFWKLQAGQTVNIRFGRHKAPVVLKQRLEELVADAKNAGGKVLFFVPPTHGDLRHRMRDFNLEEQMVAYKKELAKIAEVVDFDFDSDLTLNAKNFKDPFHINEETAKAVVANLLHVSLGSEVPPTQIDCPLPIRSITQEVIDGKNCREFL